MEPPTSLSTIYNELFDLTKKVIAYGAVSDSIHTLSEQLKKFLPSDHIVGSDSTHKLSDRVKKFLTSDAVLPDFFSTISHEVLELIKKVMASLTMSDSIHKLSDLTKKLLSSSAVADFFSTIFHQLLELIEKAMASGAVSESINTLSELIKKFLASDAVSDFIHNFSVLIQKFMDPETRLYILQWFKNENVTAAIAVVVLGLLIYSFWAHLTVMNIEAFAGKTMKAPGQNFRILRKGFEANPAAYFRNLRSRL